MLPRGKVEVAAAVAALLVVAAPGGARAAVFPFPSESSTVVSDGAAPPGEVGDFSSIDDGVSETFTASRNVNRAILGFQTPYNTLGAPLTWALEIGGRQVGTFQVPAALTVPQSVDLSFPSITGPTYQVTLRLLSDAPSGAHSFGSGGAWTHSLELLDTRAPDTRIDGDSHVVDGPTEVRFSSSATDVARFECSLDNGPFAACVSPVSYPPLRIGQHRVHVRAVDDVGNVDPTPALLVWQVTPPAACPNAAATVRAGTVSVLRFACVAYSGHTLFTDIVRPPTIGRLGPVNQLSQTVAYTAPAVAGMTSFTYRSRSNIATYDLTVRGPIGSSVRAGWRLAHGYTKARRLSVTDVPAWATVTVRCLHEGCSYHRRWAATAATHKALNLLGPLAQRRLRPGTVVEVRIAAPYATAKVVRYTIRAHQLPRRTPAQPPRSKK
jgi:hypothetical protein